MKWIEVEVEGKTRRLINADRIVAIIELKHFSHMPVCEIRFENTHSVVARTSYEDICRMLGYIVETR